jgi:hypothetical protein
MRVTNVLEISGCPLPVAQQARLAQDKLCKIHWGQENLLIDADKCTNQRRRGRKDAETLFPKLRRHAALHKKPQST